jgi:hypothetical protein
MNYSKPSFAAGVEEQKSDRNSNDDSEEEMQV